MQARVFVAEDKPAPASVISLNTLHFGDSRVEKAVRQAERLLEKDIPLLIHGETGVGKGSLRRSCTPSQLSTKTGIHRSELRGDPR